MTCTVKSYFCDIFFFRLLRRLGQSGSAQVTWSITAESPGAPSPSSTFNVSSSSVTMPDGVETVMLPIKVSQEENQLNLCRGVSYEDQIHLALSFTLNSRVSKLEYHTRNFQSASVHKEF